MMIQTNRPRARRITVAILSIAVGASAWTLSITPNRGLSFGTASAQEALRPEVGKPLQAARDLIKAGKFTDALNKLHEVDAVPNRTAGENFVLEQMRGSAAMQAGQNDLAAKSLEAVVNSGRLNDADTGRYAASLAGLYYRANNFASAVTWAQRALKANPNDAGTKQILTQAKFLSGDIASAAKDTQAEVQAAEQAGQRPPEEKLQLLANIYSRSPSDKGAYVATLEKLVTYYPKREYWVDLLRRLESKQGFSPRLQLDLYRLKLATKTLDSTDDLFEMAQLALQDRQVGEAKKIIDDGFASGLLGKGAEAERHKRLQALAIKRLGEAPKELAQIEGEAATAKDGEDLVSAGFAYVGLGQADKGIGLMQKGIAKGGLKRPDDANLHLGIAYLQAGQKAKAAHAFKAITGNDGAADLGRLWLRVAP